MNITYQVYQAERPTTAQEQRRAEARRGELAAALAGLRCKLASMLRPDGLRRRLPEPGRSAPSVESVSPISDSPVCVQVTSGCR